MWEAKQICNVLLNIIYEDSWARITSRASSSLIAGCNLLISSIGIHRKSRQPECSSSCRYFRNKLTHGHHGRVPGNASLPSALRGHPGQEVIAFQSTVGVCSPVVLQKGIFSTRGGEEGDRLGTRKISPVSLTRSDAGIDLKRGKFVLYTTTHAQPL